MGLIRRVLLGLVGTCILYYAMFMMFGSRQLAYQLGKDCNSSYNIHIWHDSINVFCDYGFSDAEFEQLTSSFKNDKKVIRAVDMKHLGTYFNSSNHFNYIIFTSSKYSPYLEISESEKIFEYGADWKKVYVWCFFCWVKLEDVMTGIS